MWILRLAHKGKYYKLIFSCFVKQFSVADMRMNVSWDRQCYFCWIFKASEFIWILHWILHMQLRKKRDPVHEQDKRKSTFSNKKLRLAWRRDRINLSGSSPLINLDHVFNSKWKIRLNSLFPNCIPEWSLEDSWEHIQLMPSWTQHIKSMT